MNVGTKELKNRLSHYLRRVREGQIVRVTDRGTVVAEIRPVGERPAGDRARLAELQELGILTVGTGRFQPMRPVRLHGRVRAAQAVLQDRG